MAAIAAEEPVVLLIDEIDKTDQEFEAMLLELLSDFQLSIPELGLYEAKTRPVVLLTSNNSRELTEALKRRCLYLWLDYPTLEHELEIVKLHAPELGDAVARKLVEVIAMIRELDLKKPPSIAESIDWARALLLLGADDIDGQVFADTMSIIVKHRTDLDVVAERVGMKLARPAACHARRLAGARRSTAAATPTRRRPGLSARILELGEELRGEGVARRHQRAARRLRRPARGALDASPSTSRRAWPRRWPSPRRTGGSSTSSSTASSSAPPRWRPCARAITEGGGMDAEGAELNLETLRQQIAQALRDGQEALMRDLARLAIAAFGRQGEGSGVIGVDVQRIRRALGLRAEPQPDLPPDDPRAEGLPRDAIRRFEALLRQELERRQIERTEALPPARPLNELDRALPSGPLQDLAAVHRVVAQLKRRLKTQGHELRGRKRHAQVDVRKTMRASLETGGVPVVLRYKPVRPRRPEIYVLCDVSTSVTSASVFFLSVLHALHDSFRKMRSFVFIERISEVTDVFERERNFKAVSEAIGRDAGVADVSGYTDYGRVWSEFATLVEDDLHPRATVIVLGDARTNGRDPRADVFAQVADKAGRTFWLNPEPRLYWNYGDSVIAAYERHCEAFECWTTGQLEDFVKALTRPVGRS